MSGKFERKNLPVPWLDQKFILLWVLIRTHDFPHSIDFNMAKAPHQSLTSWSWINIELGKLHTQYNTVYFRTQHMNTDNYVTVQQIGRLCRKGGGWK